MKGFRFRRSIGLLPGLRMNFGTKGISLSAGPRGAKVTVGPTGTRVTAGLPGTGLSMTRKVGAGGASRSRELSVAPIAADPDLVARMGVAANSAKLWIVTLSSVVMAVSFVAFIRSATASDEEKFLASAVAFLLAFIGLIIGFAIKSPYRKALIERGRRIKLLQPYADQIDREPSRAAIEDFRSRQESLHLIASDLGTLPDELQRLENRIAAEEQMKVDMQSLQERIAANGGLLPIITGHERATGADACYLAIKVFYDKRGDNDETGMLYLTNKKLIFVGTSMTEAPWTKVAKAERDGKTFSVLRRDRQNPLIFACESLSEAVQVEFIATSCLAPAAVD